MSTSTHRCTVRTADLDADVCFEVTDGERVLHEMIKHHLLAITVGCRGGGCGVCRVRVLEGEYTTRRMSRRHVSESDETRGLALACRLVPCSDIEIECSPAPTTHPTTTQPTTQPTTTTHPPRTTEIRSWQ